MFSFFLLLPFFSFASFRFLFVARAWFLSTPVYQSVRVIPWKLFCEITIEFYMQVKRGNWIRINSYHGVLLHRKSPRFVLVANYLFLNPLTGAIQVRGRDRTREREREKENYHEYPPPLFFISLLFGFSFLFAETNVCQLWVALWLERRVLSKTLSDNSAYQIVRFFTTCPKQFNQLQTSNLIAGYRKNVGYCAFPWK